jgi:hypothetical protein
MVKLVIFEGSKVAGDTVFRHDTVKSSGKWSGMFSRSNGSLMGIVRKGIADTFWLNSAVLSGA